MKRGLLEEIFFMFLPACLAHRVYVYTAILITAIVTNFVPIGRAHVKIILCRILLILSILGDQLSRFIPIIKPRRRENGSEGRLM